MYLNIDVAAFSPHNLGSIISTKPNVEPEDPHISDTQTASRFGMQNIWPTSSESVVSIPGAPTTTISEASVLTQTQSDEFPNRKDADMLGNTVTTGRMFKNSSDDCSANYVKQPSMKLTNKTTAISSSQDQISKFVTGVDLVQTPHSQPERHQSTYKSSRRTTSLLNLFLSNTQGTKRLYLSV